MLNGIVKVNSTAIHCVHVQVRERESEREGKRRERERERDRVGGEGMGEEKRIDGKLKEAKGRIKLKLCT